MGEGGGVPRNEVRRQKGIKEGPNEADQERRTGKGQSQSSGKGPGERSRTEGEGYEQMKEDQLPLELHRSQASQGPCEAGEGGQAGRPESPPLLHPEQLHA